jgi:hypothetical protein
MNRITILVAIVVLALFAGACSIDVARNADGSLEVESVLTEESVRAEIAKGLDDAQINYLNVDMKNGYALVDLERERDSGFGTDTISFRVDLAVGDGHLVANVTEAVWNGVSIPQELVDVWNDEVAAQLEAEGKKDPNSTLVAVTLTEDDLTMAWHVETDQSKS